MTVKEGRKEIVKEGEGVTILWETTGCGKSVMSDWSLLSSPTSPTFPSHICTPNPILLLGGRKEGEGNLGRILGGGEAGVEELRVEEAGGGRGGVVVVGDGEEGGLGTHLPRLRLRAPLAALQLQALLAVEDGHDGGHARPTHRVPCTLSQCSTLKREGGKKGVDLRSSCTWS